MADQQPPAQVPPPAQQPTAVPAQAPATTAAAPAPGATEAKDDYGDKALGAALDKSGYGKHVDKKTREKISDGVRGLFEKFTGKKVPAKFSN